MHHRNIFQKLIGIPDKCICNNRIRFGVPSTSFLNLNKNPLAVVPIDKLYANDDHEILEKRQPISRLVQISEMMKLQRRFKDLSIGGITARWYDNNTRKSRLAEMKAYAKEVANHIQDGCSVLEVAPGPGYLAIELAKLGKYKIVGLDISKDFLEIARRNVKEAGVEVEFRQGSVADIPFSDNMFDFIICTAAFKNFKEPFKALSQMYRVLGSGGTALIIDMDRNVSNRQIDVYIENTEANF